MFEGLYFEYPKVVTFIFIYIACEAYCKLRSSAIYFPRAAVLTRETAKVSTWMWILKWLSIVLLTLAIMSPVKDSVLELSPVEGYAIALVLDASQSMKAEGFDTTRPEKSRFDVVKAIANDFIASRKEDNLGMVLFGDYAFVASPLTYDKKILQQVVGHLDVGIAGRSTALYEAVAQAVRLLSESEAKSKIAILLSDGHNTANIKIPLHAAMALARKEEVRFYTIGIGGENEYDGALLGYIAEESGGESFKATNAQELQSVYEKIDALERSEIERYDYTFKEYFYLYPLFLAFFTLLLYVYLRNRRGWL
ncbi:VWA domain-containing protein [Sulfurimonas sp. HSL3-7]|uniref:vWA domain-containing protein n=1 Tax=Sulfonitrofixus jiaomeiensis TaxID=3131938 RepID=UPI0031F99068